MALGDNAASTGNEPAEKSFGGNYDGFQPDAEKQGGEAPRKMSRIGGPVTQSVVGMNEGRRLSADHTAEDITVGKQMELEAGNAIQYRTCSWQKV
jgi:hypothetical protein